MQELAAYDELWKQRHFILQHQESSIAEQLASHGFDTDDLLRLEYANEDSTEDFNSITTAIRIGRNREGVPVLSTSDADYLENELVSWLEEEFLSEDDDTDDENAAIPVASISETTQAPSATTVTVSNVTVDEIDKEQKSSSETLTNGNGRTSPENMDNLDKRMTLLAELMEKALVDNIVQKYKDQELVNEPSPCAAKYAVYPKQLEKLFPVDVLKALCFW